MESPYALAMRLSEASVGEARPVSTWDRYASVNPVFWARVLRVCPCIRRDVRRRAPRWSAGAELFIDDRRKPPASCVRLATLSRTVPTVRVFERPLSDGLAATHGPGLRPLRCGRGLASRTLPRGAILAYVSDTAGPELPLAIRAG